MEKIKKAARNCLIVPIIIFVWFAIFGFSMPFVASAIILMGSFIVTGIIFNCILDENLKEASPTVYNEIGDEFWVRGSRFLKWSLLSKLEDSEDVKAIKKCMRQCEWSAALTFFLIILTSILTNFFR